MAKRMQGRIGMVTLVAAVAAMTAACDLPAGFDDAGASDFTQVCTDVANNVEPDSDCASAPEDYTGTSFAPGTRYMWRYYPASGLSVSSYGKPMPSAGTLKRPVVTPSSGGSSRTPVIKTAPFGPSGGKLTPSGSSSVGNPAVKPGSSGGSNTVTRGGFGVKGGSTGSTSGSSGS